MAKNPSRAARKHVDEPEECPVVEHTAAANELSESLGIDCAKFRTGRKDRLRFGSEIERLFRLVIVDPAHPVAVVEKRRCPARPVRQEPMEPSIQNRGESGVVLVEVDEIGRPNFLHIMSLSSQAANSSR